MRYSIGTDITLCGVVTVKRSGRLASVECRRWWSRNHGAEALPEDIDGIHRPAVLAAAAKQSRRWRPKSMIYRRELSR
jgi:hypothetical protein